LLPPPPAPPLQLLERLAALETELAEARARRRESARRSGSAPITASLSRVPTPERSPSPPNSRAAPPPPPPPPITVAERSTPLPAPAPAAAGSSTELCVRLGADGSASIFALHSNSRPFESNDAALFELVVRGEGVSVAALRFNPRAALAAGTSAGAAPAAWQPRLHPPEAAQHATLTLRDASRASSPSTSSAAAGASPEPAVQAAHPSGGRSRRVRALFDTALHSVASPEPTLEVTGRAVAMQPSSTRVRGWA
jgi:hypothetical protein